MRKKNKKIAHIHHPLYKTWKNMRGRCLSKTHPRYPFYGGRGIAISREWASFDVFRKDMEKEYKKGLWLDRINNDGNYSKENCRWATPSTQAANRRSTRFLFYNGRKKTVVEWSRILKIKYRTLSSRFLYHKGDSRKILKELYGRPENRHSGAVQR